MKRTCVLFALLIGAMSTPANADLSIAVVDVQGAIFATEAAKRRQEHYRQVEVYKELLAKYERTETDLKRLSDHAKANVSTWTQEQQAEYRKKLEILGAELRVTSDKLDAHIYTAQQQIFKELLPVAEEQLRAIVDQRQISLVLKSEAVLMGRSLNDVTAELTTRIDQNIAASDRE